MQASILIEKIWPIVNFTQKKETATQNENPKKQKKKAQQKGAITSELIDISNQRNSMDGLVFLGLFESNSIPAAFFDPQYRGVMDKLDYGNEGSRQIKRAQLAQMSESIIKDFIRELDRILEPSGHLFLWIDKFHLVEGVTPWLTDTQLEKVDLVTWDKGKIGMGYRTRRRSEYLVVLQKRPKRAKDRWVSHDIPDVWLEKVTKIHPHAKPEQLQAALINAVVPEGGYVIDPASGGFSVMRSAHSVGRNFIGVDLRG